MPNPNRTCRFSTRWPSVLNNGNIKFPEKPEDVFEEMKQLSKAAYATYAGMSHDLIEQKRGIQWPYTEAQAANKVKMAPAALYRDGKFCYPDGKAKLIPLPFINNNEVPDEQFPFWLNSGRVVEHWHTRTKTGKIGNNNKFSPIRLWK